MWAVKRYRADLASTSRTRKGTAMSMPRAAASFLTSCLDSSTKWRGRAPTLNWRREARAKAFGSMSRLACAACGAEDQIATVVQPANASNATEALAGLVERVTFHENGFSKRIR